VKNNKDSTKNNKKFNAESVNIYMLGNVYSARCALRKKRRRKMFGFLRFFAEKSTAKTGDPFSGRA